MSTETAISRKTVRESFLKTHGPAVALLVLGGFLLFWGLGRQHFWQDEGENAMLAKSTLEYGYPRGMYKDYFIDLILPYDDTGYGPHYALAYYPWFPFYLIGASFKLFGFTTWAARFPMALLGFLTFPVTYALGLRLFKDRRAAFFGLAFTVTSVPVLLLLKQCRYYAPQVLFTMTALWAASYLTDRFRRTAWYGFLLSAALLLHSSPSAFVPLTGWFVLDTAMFRRYRNWPKAHWPEMITGFLLMLAVTLPWFLIATAAKEVRITDLATLRKNFEFQIRMMNKFALPVVFNTVALALLWLRRGKSNKFFGETERNWIMFLFPFIAVNLVFYLVPRQRMIRYFIQLFPVYFLLQGWVFSKLAAAWRPWFVAVCFALVCLTNFFHTSAAKIVSGITAGEGLARFKESFNSFLPLYIYEITHTYEGPISSIVAYLRDHAKPGDTVKPPLQAGADSLQFYLPELKIQNEKFFAHLNFPDWVIPRYHWVREAFSYEPEERHEAMREYLSDLESNYDRIELDTYDIIWENRPDDYGYHRFKTAVDGPAKTVIYRKRKP